MRLTRSSSYAVRALAHLAGQPGNQPLPSHALARASGDPERFLLKTLKPLVDAGVLRSDRGPNGGYRLARPAKAIALLEVVEAVSGPIRGEAPPAGDGSGAALDRRLQAACDAAARLTREQLGKVTLAELAKAR